MVQKNENDKSKTDINRSQFDEDEEFERPEWDDEQYRSKAETEDDEEFERPDWDDETWRGKLKKFLGHGPKPYLLALGLVLIVVLALPSGRTGVLNQVGARGTVSFVVLDRETDQPLRNVKVTIDENASKTDNQGRVSFEGVKLGQHQLVVEKSAYESYNQVLNVSWGENKIEDIEIEPIGVRYGFKIIDWLSEAPIAGAEVSFEDSVVTSDADGLTSINIAPQAGSTISFDVMASGYITQAVEVATDSQAVITVELVAHGKHHFISTKADSGIYSVNADGSNPALVANESPTLFTVAPNAQTGILVTETADGYDLKALDLTTGTVSDIDMAPRIDLVGWLDNSIVYLKLMPQALETSTERHKIMVYNTTTKLSRELASSNLFNDILVVGEYLFYAPSSLNLADGEKAALFRVRADGSNKTTITDAETWAILQASPDTIRYNSDNKWYQTPLNMIEQTPTEADSQKISRLYTDNPFNEQLSAWVDMTGDTPKLKLLDKVTGSDKVLTNLSGLRDPLRWLSSEHLIFRVKSQSSAGDYIININGGSPVKIVDVADVKGVESWLFYFD